MHPMNYRNTPSFAAVVSLAALALASLGACQSDGTASRPGAIPSIRSEVAAAPGEFWRDIKGTFTSKHSMPSQINRPSRMSAQDK